MCVRQAKALLKLCLCGRKRALSEQKVETKFQAWASSPPSAGAEGYGIFESLASENVPRVCRD